MEPHLILAYLLGIAPILWIVLKHRSTMEHLRARRDGSLNRDEYERGMKDGLLKAAKLVETHSACQSSYVDMIRAAAGDNA